MALLHVHARYTSSNSLHLDGADHHSCVGRAMPSKCGGGNHNLSCNHGTIRNHACIMHCIYVAMPFGGSTCVQINIIQDACTVHDARGGSIGQVIKSGVARMMLEAMRVISCIPLHNLR